MWVYQVTEEGQERKQQLFLLEVKTYSLSYHLILVCCSLKHALGPLDVEEDVGKDTNGILVTPHHKVCEAHVVIGGHLALRHPGVHALRSKDQQHSVRAETTTFDPNSLLPRIQPPPLPLSPQM